MRIRFEQLALDFHKSREFIYFPRFSYFYGPIGSGKSSIGRLIDYCLGGDIDWTPALQKELVSSALQLKVNGIDLLLKRERGSRSLIASWDGSQEDVLQVQVPARVADGEVLPKTGVEVLSDLLFYLAAEESPRVRRRKGAPDERLERLSFRDLFRFCYLDQQGMDSDFFKLNSDNYPIKQKSVDALRYILGYQTERVAELESQLHRIRELKVGYELSANALATALEGAGIDDADSLERKISLAEDEVKSARAKALAARQNRASVSDLDESLRASARGITLELVAAKQARFDIATRVDDLDRQANELEMLSVRFQRTSSARMVLGGVAFTACPRCTQPLPPREIDLCMVCGQPDNIIEADGVLNEQVVGQDLKARKSEITDALARLHSQQRALANRINSLTRDKEEADKSLTSRLKAYDSEFLANAIRLERITATKEQQLKGLMQQRKLPRLLQEQRGKAAEKLLEEIHWHAQLQDAKRAAFNDRRNLDNLANLFLDCLLRSRFPDVKETDSVQIDPVSFYPRIPLGGGGGDDAMIVLTFDNAGSGGMMALFRTCFALALHRLNAQLSGGRLPSVLIIDTATKNVSSLENPEVVSSFYRLVYELSITELRDTQFLIIDNEFTPPQPDMEVSMLKRHMKRGDPENPPLIPYLSGDFDGDGDFVFYSERPDA